jgi:hypothetical protein
VRVVIILDSTCVHVPGFRVESCDGIIMCVHVEFQLVNLSHCTSELYCSYLADHRC